MILYKKDARVDALFDFKARFLQPYHMLQTNAGRGNPFYPTENRRQKLIIFVCF